jgi:hypothetical protein
MFQDTKPRIPIALHAERKLLTGRDSESEKITLSMVVVSFAESPLPEFGNKNLYGY